MKILLDRNYKYPKFTVSDVYIDGNFYSYAMEDVDRGLFVNMPIRYLKERKVYGETAIPHGEYEVVVDWSPHFKKYMPHVKWRNADGVLTEVPGFSGIRIHSLNTAEQSQGCIGFGDWNGGNRIINSKQITANLTEKIGNAVKKGEKVTLEIR